MKSNNTFLNGVLFEHDAKTDDFGLDVAPVNEAGERTFKLVWINIILFALLHLIALYGAYLFFTSAKWQTEAFAFLLYIMAALGMTAGAHRLWSHRSYKAKWPLRLILIIFNTFTFQNSVLKWARDHRLHHKYSETDADPHNATRGFFFSHIGWLMVRKHPEVMRKGKDMDLSDLYADPFVMFQEKYFTILELSINFILPTAISVYCWDESWVTALLVTVIFRFTLCLNATWLINSAAHMWGNKPYDELINPAQNFAVTMFTFGEGYHNYHHTFPWDYKAAELNFHCLNFATHFINFFGKIGWAYDLKTVSEDIIRKRVKRTGDGSHAIWGWGDKEQSKEEIENATIVNKKDD